MAPPPAGIVRCPGCGTKNRVPAGASGVPKCGKCAAPLPWVTQAGDDDYDEVVGRATVPVLVDLWAEWCGPCRMVSPALEVLAAQMAGRLKLVKVNVDDSPALAQRFDARSVPTLLLVKGGAVVSRQVGAAPAHVLRQWVEGALSSTAGGG
ncbi:MAG: thioredoxin [Acidimicrobiales bacterium]